MRGSDERVPGWRLGACGSRACAWPAGCTRPPHGFRNDNVVNASGHRERVEALRQDIRDFKRVLGATRAVMLFTASVEILQRPPEAALSLNALEAGIDRDDPGISPTRLYAYAALREGVPFVNGTPNPPISASSTMRGTCRSRGDRGFGATPLGVALRCIG